VHEADCRRAFAKLSGTDFENIFAERFRKNVAFFAQNPARLCKILITQVGLKKNDILSLKIGENSRKY
jgi:hypothetical protein